MKNENFYRELIRSGPWHKFEDLDTDQQKNLPPPPRREEVNYIDLIELPEQTDIDFDHEDLSSCLIKRKSRRNYSERSLSLQEISFLLIMTQKIKENSNKRPAPSGGGRYPINTYLALDKVNNLKPGLYKYLPDKHKLSLVYTDENIINKVGAACFSNKFSQQRFIPDSAAVFLWAAEPYRSEWRYGILASKLIVLEAGHICQNLYLAGEMLNLGVCAIGAYDQNKIDSILNLDEDEELTVYIASVGKI
ncbi:MAG: SagB/ThcOx family dehydrogenase [Bacillota bacterium]